MGAEDSIAEEEALRKQVMDERLRRQKELEAEHKLNEITSIALTDEARARINNVKLVNKPLYLKVVQYILLLYKSGRVSGKIDENYLILMLKKFSQKKEITIKRK